MADDVGIVLIAKLAAGKTRESRQESTGVGSGRYRIDYTVANIPTGGGNIPPTP